MEDGWWRKQKVKIAQRLRVISVVGPFTFQIWTVLKECFDRFGARQAGAREKANKQVAPTTASFYESPPMVCGFSLPSSQHCRTHKPIDNPG